MKKIILLLHLLYLVQSVYAQTNTTTPVDNNPFEKILVEFQNPIVNTSSIELSLGSKNNVRLTIVDHQKRLIKIVLVQDFAAGVHKVPIDVSDIPEGDYKLKVDIPNFYFMKPLEVKHTSSELVTEAIKPKLPPVASEEKPAIPPSGGSFTKPNPIVEQAEEVKNIVPSSKDDIQQVDHQVKTIEQTISEPNKVVKETIEPVSPSVNEEKKSEPNKVAKEIIEPVSPPVQSIVVEEKKQINTSKPASSTPNNIILSEQPPQQSADSSTPTVSSENEDDVMIVDGKVTTRGEIKNESIPNSELDAIQKEKWESYAIGYNTIRDGDEMLHNFGINLPPNSPPIYPIEDAEKVNPYVGIEFINPMRKGNLVRLTVEQKCKVNMVIKDENGKVVENVMNWKLDRGLHDVAVALNGIPPGNYVLQTIVGKSVENRKLVVVPQDFVPADKSDINVNFTNPMRTGNSIRVVVGKRNKITMRIIGADDKELKQLMDWPLDAGIKDIPLGLDDFPVGRYYIETIIGRTKEVQELDVIR